MPLADGRPGQSWRTFMRNQAIAFGHREHAEERSRRADGLDVESIWTQLNRSGAAEIATGCIGLRRRFAQPQTLNEARTGQRSAYCDRGVIRHSAAVFGGSGHHCISAQRALFRYEVHRVKLAAAIEVVSGRTQDVALAQSRTRIHHVGSRSQLQNGTAPRVRISLRADQVLRNYRWKATARPTSKACRLFALPMAMNTIFIASRLRSVHRHPIAPHQNTARVAC